MKRLILLSAVMAIFSLNTESYSQNLTAKDQCKKLSRGVNLIGYDKDVWWSQF